MWRAESVAAGQRMPKYGAAVVSSAVDPLSESAAAHALLAIVDAF
jgi:hypothetical protein